MDRQGIEKHAECFKAASETLTLAETHYRAVEQLLMSAEGHRNKARLMFNDARTLLMKAAEAYQP